MVGSDKCVEGTACNVIAETPCHVIAVTPCNVTAVTPCNVTVSYTPIRAHAPVLELGSRILLNKKNA